MDKIKEYIVGKIPGLIIAINYISDFKQYNKYNYSNKNNKSFAALQGKIFRQTHIIEKGMSLSNPRKGFGIKKLIELFDYLDKYSELEFPNDSIVFLNAINVINKYIEFQKKKGYVNSDVEKRLEQYLHYINKDFNCGIFKETKSHLREMCKKEFPEFLASRHSIRQFDESDIDYTFVRKAVELAMKSPSACNRQSAKVYLFHNERIKEQLDEVINGNTGFAKEVKNYLIITSDSSCYTSAYERNQMYVDGSLFAMTLMLSLHYYGIGCCALQNSETRPQYKAIRRITGIHKKERIIIFLAIGNYKDNFNIAVSKRKNLQDVLIEN